MKAKRTPLYLLASFESKLCGGDAISVILAATSGAPTGIAFDIVVVWGNWFGDAESYMDVE